MSDSIKIIPPPPGLTEFARDVVIAAILLKVFVVMTGLNIPFLK